MSYTTLASAFPFDSSLTPAAPPPTDHFHGKTVLVVDDDSAVLSLLGETIAALGHRVIVAHDGPGALRCLLRHRKIDCLFTDAVMPNGMTGLQLMAAARALRPGLPAVIASAYPREDVSAMGDIPDDVAFIAKPYLLTDLYPLLDGMPQARKAFFSEEKKQKTFVSGACG